MTADGHIGLATLASLRTQCRLGPLTSNSDRYAYPIPSPRWIGSAYKQLRAPAVPNSEPGRSPARAKVTAHPTFGDGGAELDQSDTGRPQAWVRRSRANVIACGASPANVAVSL